MLRAYSSGATNDPIPTNDSTPPKKAQNVSDTSALPASSNGAHDHALNELPSEGGERRAMQAPNREGTWSRGQQSRSKAMAGPRFEQTILEDQPQPYAAIELIHKQPVRWVKERVVSCDGGGGPLGHPRIFINVDKPEINCCTYCGLPFPYGGMDVLTVEASQASHHHKAHLESLQQTSYPLAAQGDAAEVPESQRVSNEALGQR
ncbi:MAG: hypothetical protein M1840_005960 [Geoglossum simile]|nr:MAG: hypothetical protein M1840_005960 [Geoglossum simile]